MKKTELFDAFMRGAPLCVYFRVYGVETFVDFAVINKIEREDGSNLSYIVTGIETNGDRRTQCVRVTEDVPWREVAEYPVADWARECRDGDTRLGYAQWVEQQQVICGGR